MEFCLGESSFKQGGPNTSMLSTVGCLHQLPCNIHTGHLMKGGSVHHLTRSEYRSRAHQAQERGSTPVKCRDHTHQGRRGVDEL